MVGMKHLFNARMRFLTVFLMAGLAPVLAQGPKWTVSYKLPAKIKTDVAVPIVVTVVDEKKKPVAGATVETVLTMTEMDHGEFKAGSKETGPGVYQSMNKFLMSGGWQIEVRVAKGASKVSKKFKYELKD
ncbi:MAG: hypothetical protein FJW40_13675 [Acidobacteria bacterium]|nr:hypothetical protein [Acidobacteriota bacterium]